MSKTLSKLLAMLLVLGLFSCTSKQRANQGALPQDVSAQLDTSSMQLKAVGNQATFVPKNISVNAAIDVNCGNHTYTISTGNINGWCTVDWDTNHRVTGGRCLDQNNANSVGNNATVMCNSGCMDASGSGSCTKKN